MTSVCVYTRISTDEENQPTSLASQHERLEAFCKVQEDWRIIAHHEDRATGTKLDRPGLQAALDLARQGRIDQLLVYRIDRLSRKVRQLASIAEELVVCQATFAVLMSRFRRGLLVLWLRQWMYRRMRRAWVAWSGWSVPASVKYRSARNCASILFSQEA
jgi:hypothetical protein